MAGARDVNARDAAQTSRDRPSSKDDRGCGSARARQAHAAALPHVLQFFVGAGDGSLNGAERVRHLLDAVAGVVRVLVLAGGEKVVIAMRENSGGVDLVQALGAALADKRDLGVLVV